MFFFDFLRVIAVSACDFQEKNQPFTAFLEIIQHISPSVI